MNSLEALAAPVDEAVAEISYPYPTDERASMNRFALLPNELTQLDNKIGQLGYIEPDFTAECRDFAVGCAEALLDLAGEYMLPEARQLLNNVGQRVFVMDSATLDVVRHAWFGLAGKQRRLAKRESQLAEDDTFLGEMVRPGLFIIANAGVEFWHDLPADEQQYYRNEAVRAGVLPEYIEPSARRFYRQCNVIDELIEEMVHLVQDPKLNLAMIETLARYVKGILIKQLNCPHLGLRDAERCYTFCTKEQAKITVRGADPAMILKLCFNQKLVAKSQHKLIEASIREKLDYLFPEDQYGYAAAEARIQAA